MPNINEEVTYNATINNDSTTPITYSNWSIINGVLNTDYQIISGGGNTANIRIKWLTQGTRSIRVTASNCGGSITRDSQDIIVQSLSANKLMSYLAGDESFYELQPTSESAYFAVNQLWTEQKIIIQDVFLSNGLNIGSNVTKTISGGAFGSGILVYYDYVANQFKYVQVTNSNVSSLPANLIAPIIPTVSNTKLLFPYNHYDGSTLLGNGYAAYQNVANNPFWYWASQLNIATDGLTITEQQWASFNGTSQTWFLNGEYMPVPLVNFKIPIKYKGQVIDIEIEREYTVGNINTFHYLLLVGN